MGALKRFFRKNFIFLLVILLSLISSHSLFHSGLVPTHDGEYHVIRFFEFDKSFRTGDIYPRWAPDLNNGFGIPLFNYVYPLPNYFALLFHSFGFSFIDSFKINLIVATILGSFFMYLWARHFWGEIGGLISSVFYTFSPYHLLDIYIRGSVGEVWALAFFPGYLWAITKFISEKKSKYLILSSVFLSLIIFSHNILSFMFFFFAISYLLFLLLKEKRKLIYSSIFILISGIGISSVFWFPAIFERQYVRGLEIYDYSKNFPQFYQLIIPSWGSGFSSDLLQNQLSFQIGIANLLVIVASLFFLFRKDSNRKFILFFLIWFLIVFFLMLKISLPVWQNLPFFNYFQFPWRFLSLEILFASFVSGSLVKFLKYRVIAITLIMLPIILGIGYTDVAYYLERDDSYYTTKSNFIDGTNSSGNVFNTVWMSNLKKQKNKLVFAKGDGSVIVQSKNPTNYLFTVRSKNGGELIANIAYFPNWTVYINNNIQKINKTTDGLFSLKVPKGVSEIRIKLEDTNVRRSAILISLLSILTLFTYSRFVRIKK